MMYCIFNTHVWFLIHFGCHSIIVQGVCVKYLQTKTPSLLVNNIILTDCFWWWCRFVHIYVQEVHIIRNGPHRIWCIGIAMCCQVNCHWFSVCMVKLISSDSSVECLCYEVLIIIIMFRRRWRKQTN